MQPPQVTLENSAAVYEYYRGHEPQVWRAQLNCAFLAAKYRPRITYQAGAKRQLKAANAARTPLLICINHLSADDPYVIAALAARSALRPRIGHIRTLAKDELFAEPGQRAKVDQMGAIPVFRSKNHGIRAIAEAGQQMMGVCVDRLARGDSVALFPEGTINQEDPAVLQHIGTGVGHILSKAMKAGVHPALLCIGMSHDPEAGKPVRSSVYLDNPVIDLPARPIELTRLVTERLQAAVTAAVARR